MSTNNNRKLTNRLHVVTETMYWVVNVVTEDGHITQGFYPNSKDLYGSKTAGVTPRWFINGIRDMRDTTKFPFLNRAMADLAILVNNTSISLTRAGCTPWADVEVELFRISRLARYGVSEDTSTTLTYKPAEPSMPESATVSRVGGGLTKEDLAMYEGKPTCVGCFLIVTEGGCGC
jgi:hypothetical protein